MIPTFERSPENAPNAPQQSTQNLPQAPGTGFVNGSWGYRDVAMFSTQGISGIGALTTLMLGGWNTAFMTPSAADCSNNQTSSLTTTNSYVLITFGIFFTVATIIQVGAHYHWRQDNQDAKNTNLKSLGDELEKNFQEFQVIIEKAESIRKQMGVLNQEPAKGIQMSLGEDRRRLPDDKILLQTDPSAKV